MGNLRLGSSTLCFPVEGGDVALIPFAWIAAPDFEAETTHGKIKVRSEVRGMDHY
jgi:hypothetical protein